MNDSEVRIFYRRRAEELRQARLRMIENLQKWQDKPIWTVRSVKKS